MSLTSVANSSSCSLASPLESYRRRIARVSSLFASIPSCCSAGLSSRASIAPLLSTSNAVNACTTSGANPTLYAVMCSTSLANSSSSSRASPLESYRRRIARVSSLLASVPSNCSAGDSSRASSVPLLSLSKY
eukprot:71729-Prymnesium_polylepis.2